jgi:hypothetical protein
MSELGGLVALGVTDGWPHSQDALPSGVSVRLEPKAGRVNYLMGEPIAKTDRWDGLGHATEVELACLEGDIAARKKAALYLTGRDDITGIRKKGLALSKKKELELQLLDEAWRSIDRIPDQYFLDEMIELRHLQVGIPVPDSYPVVPGRTKDETVRDLAERALYIDEIAASMPQRQGANKSASQEFLDQEKKDHDFLSRVAE